MGTCRKPLCNKAMAAGSAYCAEHKAMPNIVLPPAPMAVLVRQGTHQGLPPPAVGVTRHRRTPGIELSASLPHHRRTNAVSDLSMPTPHHRRTGALSSAPQAHTAPTSDGAKQFYGQKQVQAAAMEARVGSPAYMQALLSAFHDVKMSDGYERCWSNEAGTWNRNAMAGKVLRALAPAMAMRPMLEDVGNLLRRLALGAAANNHVFAEGYYLELSLCVDHMIEKKDIGFILGQATSILGPLLLPLAPAVSAATGVAAGVISKAQSAVVAGLKKGVQVALADAPPNVPGLPPPQRPMLPIPGLKPTQVDPMRFTLAWMAYVTGGGEPATAGAVRTILAEFGGRGAVESVQAFLIANNV